MATAQLLNGRLKFQAYFPLTSKPLVASLPFEGLRILTETRPATQKLGLLPTRVHMCGYARTHRHMLMHTCTYTFIKSIYFFQLQGILVFFGLGVRGLAGLDEVKLSLRLHAPSPIHRRPLARRAHGAAFQIPF